MKTVGELFDPRLHEAISEVPGTPKGAIVDEASPGYHLGDAVLRAARVVVASGAQADSSANQVSTNAGGPSRDQDA